MFKGKLTIDVLVSFNLAELIQMMHVLEFYYYELYSMDEKRSMTISRWKVKVDHICSNTCLIHDLYFVYVV